MIKEYVPAIRIGAYDYIIQETDEPLLVNNLVCDGACCSEELLIEMSTDTPREGDRIKQTLCHEVVHAIVNEYGIIIPNDVLEIVVDAFGTGFFQVIKDNPHLTAFIQNGIVEKKLAE